MALPAARRTIGEKYGFCWQQTMLRIKDPNVSVPFYERHFGMKLVRMYENHRSTPREYRGLLTVNCTLLGPWADSRFFFFCRQNRFALCLA